jgi:hypothetical protein
MPTVAVAADAPGADTAAGEAGSPAGSIVAMMWGRASALLTV